VTDETDAVELLIEEAWAACREGRYVRAAAAAERAVRAAEELDDAELLVDALVAEAEPLRMRGELAAALVRYTRVLALADNPSSAQRLGGEVAAWAVANSYQKWVDCARFLPGMSWRDMFGVLNAAERWLTSTGRRHWQGGVLLQRANLHHMLRDWDAAIAAGLEALAAYRPEAPGYGLGTYRFQVGDILRDAGRHREARPLYQAILDDPDSTSYVRRAAHRGLARCALADDDPATARPHAEAAVRLAEPFGEGALCEPLQALIAACRAVDDLHAAWQAATRLIDAASRVGGHYRPYFATLDAVDVALDRGDLESARGLLADLDGHATALDTTAGTTTTTHADAAAERHRRFAELAEEAP
jgi:tetratricopeptide (TPR) repeat protein